MRLCLILFLLFFTSCKSSSLVTKAKEDYKKTTHKKDSTNTDTSKKSVISEDKLSEKDIVITNIVYDTDKPINTSTNKHPVKSKTDITIKAKDKSESSSSNKEEKREVAINNSESDSEIKFDREVKEKINKKSFTESLKGVIWGVLSIIIVVLIYKILRRFKLL